MTNIFWKPTKPFSGPRCWRKWAWSSLNHLQGCDADIQMFVVETDDSLPSALTCILPYVLNAYHCSRLQVRQRFARGAFSAAKIWNSLLGQVPMANSINNLNWKRSYLIKFKCHDSTVSSAFVAVCTFGTRLSIFFYYSRVWTIQMLKSDI